MNIEKKFHCKIFKIKDPIYGFDLTLLVGDKEWYESYCEKRFADAEKSDNQGGESFVSSEAKSYIWLPKINFTSANYGALSHELLHITLRVMEKIGFKFSYDNQEPIAYYLEYMMTETLWSLTKYLKKK